MGHLRLVRNNPTGGGQDGEVIILPTSNIPINAIVNVGIANHTLVKLALRCDVGYSTTGDCELTFLGTNSDKWSIADGAMYPTMESAETATYTPSLVINTPINDRNHVIWLKASTDGNEPNMVDTSVSLRVWGRTVSNGGA
jgi:hypothetical protein